MRMMNNKLWILGRIIELPLRLFVEAHRCSAGHRSYEVKLGKIKEYVYIESDREGRQGIAA
jgi:hypothetical protein